MNVQMTMSSAQTLFSAVTEFKRAGFRAGKGQARQAYPHVLVVKGVPDDMGEEVRHRILRIDPASKPVLPPGSFVSD